MKPGFIIQHKKYPNGYKVFVIWYITNHKLYLSNVQKSTNMIYIDKSFIQREYEVQSR